MEKIKNSGNCFVDELSRQLEVESTRRTQLESTNFKLREEITTLKLLCKSHQKLEKSKLQLEEEVANLKHQLESNLPDCSQIEQTQAASQETLEQMRATSTASLRNQLENRIKELESELAKFKNSHQDFILQTKSTHTELEKYKGLYLEEVKTRKFLESKLERAYVKLAEANTELYHERHKNESSLANSLISGSLSSSPVVETAQMENRGNNLSLNQSLNFGGGFLNSDRSRLASINSVETYIVQETVFSSSEGGEQSYARITHCERRAVIGEIEEERRFCP
ncbi:ankyrin repeat domain-containing protein 26-like [Erythrolamprus reginae]|uniref:ankyrin repeat domain-containing protein 26-like n=1 Tax=Erythrolamprus reginae TaxID=121349 RepID=UPI00396C2EED